MPNFRQKIREDFQMKTSIMASILKELLKGKTQSSTDLRHSNTNQYFRQIKKQGIELVEVWKPNIYNSGKHKERKLYQSIENIKRTEELLMSLQGIKA